MPGSSVQPTPEMDIIPIPIAHLKTHHHLVILTLPYAQVLAFEYHVL